MALGITLYTILDVFLFHMERKRKSGRRVCNKSRMSATSYYAVAVGRGGPAIYRNWEQCQAQVTKFLGVVFKKFSSEKDAEMFISINTVLNAPPLPTDAWKPKLLDIVDSLPVNSIKIFTDGACSSNGKAKARAAYSCVFPDYSQYNMAQKLDGDIQTNNRAEYSAFILAYSVAAEIDPSGTRPRIVFSDSKLLVDTVNEWMIGWKARNWARKGGQIANLDLIKRIDELWSIGASRGDRLIHVAAHTGGKDYCSIHNDTADKLATSVL